MYRFALMLIATFALINSSGAAEPRQIFGRPAVSARQIAFGYAGDLWVVERTGGTARRLTAGTGLESHPVFSPDGSQVAFAGEYEGNLDVYVVPVDGGQPQRLTYHPDPDLPVGWTPDGKSVVFRSTRASGGRYTRLFTVPVTGGPETEIPLPMAEEASLSPDGSKLAYVPFTNTRAFPGGYIAWKRYRGGSAPFVWIADLKTSAIEKLPRTDSNDFNPMWIDHKVYFLSDRDGSTTLYAYDLETKQVKLVLKSNGRDIKSSSACADAIAFDRIDGLYLYDLQTEKATRLEIQVRADLPAARPRREKIAKHIQNVRLSPTGARVLVEARGEIVTVPAEKGDARNLTGTPGIAERDPARSPDGKTVAYFSDASGEYELLLKPQNGLIQGKTYKLGDAPSFYYSPTWSPDSKRIAYTDKRKNLWCLDLATGKSTKVDTDPQALGQPPTPAWSPDSKWIAYTRSLQRTVGAVFLYSFETGKTYQITDGMSNAAMPAFDKGGKYLYFTASTDDGPIAFGSMSAFNRAQTNSVYLIVLCKDDPSPLLPESDEEKEAAAKAADKDKDKEKSAPKVSIDLENIDQRIVALPVSNRNYVGLQTGKEGTLFFVEGEAVRVPRRGPLSLIVHKFDLGKRKAEKLLDGVRRFVVSHNGEKMLYQLGDKWFLTATPAAAKPGEGTGPPKSGEGPSPIKPGEGAVKLEDVEIGIDPRAEWRQIYRETWRIERDFLYDPDAHGLDLAAAEKKYQPYLAGLGSRHDLSLLMEEMLGELCLGHVYIAGGDTPTPPDLKTGLLGADYAVENNHYK